ncbi:unnamed protein product [Sphagnum troendelagicum]|uniref:Longin domain-containing protein n=1 Tax=Sphagnum troendelagicum TaxID=128251 RepID=A0ABP0TCQ2_9BRYO
MEGQSLIYSFVASGANVLAEYTAFNGNFSTIAVQCLQKLLANNNKFTYTCDHHTFNYLVDDGYNNSVFRKPQCRPSDLTSSYALIRTVMHQLYDGLHDVILELLKMAEA